MEFVSVTLDSFIKISVSLFALLEQLLLVEDVYNVIATVPNVQTQSFSVPPAKMDLSLMLSVDVVKLQMNVS